MTGKIQRRRTAKERRLGWRRSVPLSFIRKVTLTSRLGRGLVEAVKARRELALLHSLWPQDFPLPLKDRQQILEKALAPLLLPRKMMLEPSERKAWIVTTLLRNARFPRVDVLNREFVAMYAAATGASVQAMNFGADRCRTLGADLGALHKEGKLVRHRLGIEGLRGMGMGFPTWVWSYQLPPSARAGDGPRLPPVRFEQLCWGDLDQGATLHAALLQGAHGAFLEVWTRKHNSARGLSCRIDICDTYMYRVP